jgi:hypothetical protein
MGGRSSGWETWWRFSSTGRQGARRAIWRAVSVWAVTGCGWLSRRRRHRGAGRLLRGQLVHPLERSSGKKVRPSRLARRPGSVSGPRCPSTPSLQRAYTGREGRWCHVPGIADGSTPLVARAVRKIALQALETEAVV